MRLEINSANRRYFESTDWSKWSQENISIWLGYYEDMLPLHKGFIIEHIRRLEFHKVTDTLRWIRMYKKGIREMKKYNTTQAIRDTKINNIINE